MRAALSSSAARTRPPRVQPNWRQTSRSIKPDTSADNLAVEVTLLLHKRAFPDGPRDPFSRSCFFPKLSE